MDLTALDLSKQAEAGVEIELKHPATEAGLGAFITVLGRDSRKYRQSVIDYAVAQSKRKSFDPTLEDLDAKNAADAATLTTGWRGVELDGKALDYSPENAHALYARFAWVREQVLAAAGERANFLPKSPPKS